MTPSSLAHLVASGLFVAAAVGVAMVALEYLLLRRHVRAPTPTPGSAPVSILKPLCGLDDGLAENLASFARLDHPEYEVVLGLRSRHDPAWEVACAAARRWPGRFRVVLQRGEPGLNPKVNQLVTLARAARHDVLVVSDSNVRVDRGYLAEITGLLRDERIGLVTHPLVGVGERQVGSIMDHLHLAAGVTPAMIAAQLAGCAIVVGKSMALRRRDLVALGGFEAVKDVLAEDWVMGIMVRSVLGKRIVVARRPIRNASTGRSMAQFADRYFRWGVLQRQAVGPLLYLCYALLNPVLLAAVGAAVEHTPATLGCFAAVSVVKAALDRAAVRLLRPGPIPLSHLALTPVKDLVFGAAWAYGLVQREVDWRGNRIVVGPGTRIEAATSRSLAVTPLEEGIHAAEETVAS